MSLNPNEIQAAIQHKQVAGPVSQVLLRALVRRGRWAEIGRLFDFEPVYVQVDRDVYFNWACLPKSFWAVYSERRHRAARGSTHTGSQPLQKLRLRRFKQQKGLCYYCKQPTSYARWTLDHKQPLSRGGRNCPENKVGCCGTCNQAKANLTEAEFRATPAERRKDAIRSLKLSPTREILTGSGWSF